MLPMNIEKQRCKLPQRGDGAWLIVDIDPIPFISRNFATHNNFIAFTIQTEPLEFASDIGLKYCLGDSAGLTSTNHVGRSFRPREQAEGVDDDRFARSGFSRQEA